MNSDNYCQHGSYVGNSWGPDYICPWCEDGISVEEMRSILDDDAMPTT